LIDVAGWHSHDYNSLVEDFLLHRKRNPFLRGIWGDPQSVQIIEHLLFVFGQSRGNFSKFVEVTHETKY
jgi:hypothetical protein